MKFYIIKYAVLVVGIICIFSVVRTVGAEPDPIFAVECPKDSTFALQSSISRRFKKFKTIVKNYLPQGGSAVNNAPYGTEPACAPLAQAGFCVSYPTEMQAYCCETVLDCEPDFPLPLATDTLGGLEQTSGSFLSLSQPPSPDPEARPKTISKRHDTFAPAPSAENGSITEPARATEAASDGAFVKVSSSLGSIFVEKEPTNNACSCSHDGLLPQERGHVCDAISESLQLVEKAQDMLASLWDRRRRRRLVNARLYRDVQARRRLLPNKARNATRTVELSREQLPVVDLGYEDPSVHPYTESGVDFDEAARLSRESITSSTLGEMADLMSQFFDLVIHDYVGLAEEAVGLMLEILPGTIDVPNISAVELQIVNILRHIASRMENCDQTCLAPVLAAVLEGGLVAGQSPPRTVANMTTTAVQRAVSRVLKGGRNEGLTMQEQAEGVDLEDAKIFAVRLLRQFADSFELVLDNAPPPHRSPFRPADAARSGGEQQQEGEHGDAETRGKTLSSINALIIHGIQAMGGVWHGLTSPDFMQDMLRVVFLVDRNLNRLSAETQFQQSLKICWQEGLCCQSKPVPAFLRSSSPKAQRRKRELRALLKRALADAPKNDMATTNPSSPEAADTKQMNFLPDVGRPGSMCTADDPTAFLASLENRFSDVTCDKIVALSSCFPTATIVEVEDLLLACIETWVRRCDNEANRQHLLKVKGREAVVLVDNFVRTREVCGQSVASGTSGADILVPPAPSVTEEKRATKLAEGAALSLSSNAFYPIIVVLVLGLTRMQFADLDFQ